MDTVQYLLGKFSFNDYKGPMPIEIPLFRHRWGELFNELGFRVGVEVGVERGVFSEMLCKGNPEGKLYGIDPWLTIKGYREHVDQGKLNGFLEETKQRMAPYNFEPIRKFSMDAVKDFKDKSIDYVYIDGNHDFQNVTNDIVEWSKKVRPGGIISGHDYTQRKGKLPIHVVEVVNGYTQAYKISPWFTVIRSEKCEENLFHNTRSWMWVKR